MLYMKTGEFLTGGVNSILLVYALTFLSGQVLSICTGGLGL